MQGIDLNQMSDHMNGIPELSNNLYKGTTVHSIRCFTDMSMRSENY